MGSALRTNHCLLGSPLPRAESLPHNGKSLFVIVSIFCPSAAGESLSPTFLAVAVYSAESLHLRTKISVFSTILNKKTEKIIFEVISISYFTLLAMSW